MYYLGSTATFRGYGLVCLIVLGAFIFINFYRKDEGGFVSDIPVTEDPHQVESILFYGYSSVIFQQSSFLHNNNNNICWFTTLLI